MKAFILEIKAKSFNNLELEHYLLEQGANYKGEDHQIDTYFNIDTGRLKLREGTIENTLIYYNRIENKDQKESTVLFQKLGNENAGLKDILTKLHGIKTIVDKKRKIFFIENVKFHLDNVVSLGEFVEIEAIDYDGSLSSKHLEGQLTYYKKAFRINKDDFLSGSYSDMIMEL